MEALALQAAQLAVQRDGEGRLEEAVQQYEECVRLLGAAGKAEQMAALCSEYTMRARLLMLRIFQQKGAAPAPLSERLKELRGGKDSPVESGRVVFTAEEEEEDEDEQSRKLVAQLQAELALEGEDMPPPQKETKTKPAVYSSDSDSSAGVSPDNSDDDTPMRAIKAKARAEHEARKQRVKRRNNWH